MPVPTPHDTELYTLGSGIGYFGKWSGSTPPVFAALAGFTDVGNIVDLSLTPSTEVLEHFSTRSKAKSLDKEATLQKNMEMTIELDEISVENFRSFLMGTISATNSRRIQILQNSNQEYAFYFVSDNEEGENFKLFVPKMKLTPNGAASFIGDDWMTLAMTGKALADETNNPTEPFGHLEFQTTTSTTTTTTTTAP